MTQAVRMILADIEQGATLDEALARVGQSNNIELRQNVLAHVSVTPDARSYRTTS